MASKTYKNHRPGSVAWVTKDEFGNVKNDTLPFVNGMLTTDDADLQKHVEALPAFKEGWISFDGPAEQITAAEIKAKALRVVANKAEAEAVAAEGALAALVKAAAPAAA